MRPESALLHRKEKRVNRSNLFHAAKTVRQQLIGKCSLSFPNGPSPWGSTPENSWEGRSPGTIAHTLPATPKPPGSAALASNPYKPTSSCTLPGVNPLTLQTELPSSLPAAVSLCPSMFLPLCVCPVPRYLWPCLYISVSPCVSPCLSLSVCPCISVSLDPSLCLPVSLYLPVSLSLHVSPSVSVLYLGIYGPVSTSLCLPVSLHVSPSLSLYLGVSGPVSVSLALSLCLCVSPSPFLPALWSASRKGHTPSLGSPSWAGLVTGFNPREPDGEAGTGEVDTVGLGTQQEEQGTDGWGDTGWLKVRKWSPTAAPASTAALTPSPCLPGPSGCRLQDRALPLLLTWKGGGDSSSHGVPPPRGVTWTSPDAVPIGPRP